MENNYRLFHSELLQQAYERLIQHPPFKEVDNVDDAAFLDNLLKTIDATKNQCKNYQEQGQRLMALWIRRYPTHATLIPRDLLWFYGGDCLHFMPDEEIQLFQKLDEARWHYEATSKPYNYADIRHQILS